MLQGVPIGLAFGTMPFLLKSHSSYSDIAIFALSTYPYSLKLFWSPIVDSIFVENLKIGGLNLSLGRRKSWIVPIQMMLGGMLWVLSGRIEEIMNQVSKRVRTLFLSMFFSDRLCSDSFWSFLTFCYFELAHSRCEVHHSGLLRFDLLRCNSRYRSRWLGIDFVISRKCWLCFYCPNSWNQHRLLHEFHSLLGSQ